LGKSYVRLRGQRFLCFHGSYYNHLFRRCQVRHNRPKKIRSPLLS
jgi:hypothetical protein